MTSDLSIGTAVQSGNRTIVTGTTSGLDTNSLIENTVAQNNSRADKIDIRIQDNQNEIDALETYYGLANGVQDSLASLKSVTGFSGEDSNVFESRTGNLSYSNSTADLISVTIEEGAKIDDYNIVVDQKAEAQSVKSQNIASISDPLGIAGEFTIGLADGISENIVIGVNDSLQNIADVINARSSSTGVEASILKVSENNYQLILTGQETNKAIQTNTLSGAILSDLGFTDPSSEDTFLASQITQEAQGSRIFLNGAEITRDDNNYDDLINGVSFEIRNADANNTVTLEIGNDAQSAKDAILAFVESYNALRDFILQNQEVGADGTVPDDAVLFSEPVLENLSYSLSSLLSGGSTNDNAVSGLRDIGIVYDDENRLILDDETALDDALINNFEQIHNFFTTDVTTPNSQLGLIQNTSRQASLDFTIDIKTDINGNISSATVAGNPGAFEIDGDRLIGRQGTAYEGLTFAYIGSDDAQINVSLKAGIADLLNNSIEAYTDPTSGLIQNEISVLQDANSEYEAEAQKIRDRGEEIREREINRYAAMEAELASLESLQRTIRQLLGTSDD